MSVSRVLTEVALDSEILKKLPARDPMGNKGTFGHVLIIGGSENMCGAALFAAKAAYRAGCGLVRIVTPECNRVILQTALPEAILTTVGDGASDMELEHILDGALAWADAVVIGPGLGMSEHALSLVKTVLFNARVPTVIDADALNFIAKRGLSYPADAPCIITPHVGEFSRLLDCPINRLKEALPTVAATYAKQHGITVVAKDAHTAISDGDELYINESGTSALAKGGTGDVLAGLIGALLARGVVPFDAAKLGVYIHGLAGQYAARTWGDDGVLAGEVADCVALVIKDAREGKLDV